ncbi:MAG: GNAT family N-acetyltransferase [Deltaproteobacteria bacterium]|nr:GNAT family N-acetyltransferase [Deltaproteobacteria bacterium]
MYDRFEPKQWTQGLPPRSDERREEWLRCVLRDGINILAIMEGQAIGHAALFEMEPRKSCEYLVFVHQDYQNRGIGIVLTQVMKELAEEMGYRQIWVTVEVINFKAIHIYEKLGFRRVGPMEIECEMVLYLKEDNEGP